MWIEKKDYRNKAHHNGWERMYVFHFADEKEFDHVVYGLESAFLRDLMGDTYQEILEPIINKLKGRKTDRYSSDTFKLSCVMFDDEIVDYVLAMSYAAGKFALWDIAETDEDDTEPYKVEPIEIITTDEDVAEAE